MTNSRQVNYRPDLSSNVCNANNVLQRRKCLQSVKSKDIFVQRLIAEIQGLFPVVSTKTLSKSSTTSDLSSVAPKFAMQGSGEITCQGSGKWSKKPICKCKKE